MREKYRIYEKAFEECVSYLDYIFNINLALGNKALAHKYLQVRFRYSYDPIGTKKALMLIKQGIEEREIKMQFLWNTLGCPKSVDELNPKDKPMR